MNEFINFNKRGFLLPDGCKDLIDVLATRQKAAPPAGGFQDIERFVSRLLKTPAQMRLLSIRSSEPPAMIAMWCTAEFFSVAINTEATREKAIRRIFSEAEIPLFTEHPLPGHKVFSRVLFYSFPTVETQVVRLLTDCLFSGFGLPTDAKLDFDYNERPAPAK